MIVVLPGNPTTVPCSFFQARTRSMSRPSWLWIAPPVSETAMTVEPSSTHELRGDRAGVAEALDGDGGLGEVHAEVLRRRRRS